MHGFRIVLVCTILTLVRQISTFTKQLISLKFSKIWPPPPSPLPSDVTYGRPLSKEGRNKSGIKIKVKFQYITRINRQDPKIPWCQSAYHNFSHLNIILGSTNQPWWFDKQPCTNSCSSYWTPYCNSCSWTCTRKFESNSKTCANFTIHGPSGCQRSTRSNWQSSPVCWR